MDTDNKDFDKLRWFFNDIKTDKGKSRIQCMLCGRTYANKEGAVGHYRKVHMKGDTIVGPIHADKAIYSEALSGFTVREIVIWYYHKEVGLEFDEAVNIANRHIREVEA